MHSETCSRRNEIINQMPQRHAKNAHTNARTHTHTTNWVWSWVHKTKRCLWNLMLSSSSSSFPACYLRFAFSLCCGRILRLVLIYAPCSDTHTQYLKRYPELSKHSKESQISGRSPRTVTTERQQGKSRPRPCPTMQRDFSEIALLHVPLLHPFLE